MKITLDSSLENATLEKEEIAFRARPSGVTARLEREAAVFDEIAERYSVTREEAARALIDYASKPRQSDAPTPAECDHQYFDADGNRVYLHCKRCDARDPLEPNLRAIGTWRVYFHRLNPDGLPWCVAPDAGGWEIAVANVAIDAPSSTVYAPKSTPDDEDGRPSAWIAVTGVLTVSAAGQARIGAA